MKEKSGTDGAKNGRGWLGGVGVGVQYLRKKSHFRQDDVFILIYPLYSVEFFINIFKDLGKIETRLKKLAKDMCGRVGGIKKQIK